MIRLSAENVIACEKGFISANNEAALRAAIENAELAEQNIARITAWERNANELKREVAYWKGKTEEATTELAELNENYDELVKTKRDYAEEIDRLRKVVIDLQTNRFTTDEFIGMLVKNFMPSADK